MVSSPVKPSHSLRAALGDARWVRAHISTLAVGAVVLVSINLLIGSDELWSLTAIGIWAMLFVVHLAVLVIARLSGELLDDDEEEIVLLPVQDAVIVHPATTPVPTPAPTIASEPAADQPRAEEAVSWQVATDAAQVRREPAKDES